MNGTIQQMGTKLIESELKGGLTCLHNAVGPAPGEQGNGVVPKPPHWFGCSSSNNNQCSHPTPLANHPSQHQLQEPSQN